MGCTKDTHYEESDIPGQGYIEEKFPTAIIVQSDKTLALDLTRYPDTRIDDLTVYAYKKEGGSPDIVWTVSRQGKTCDEAYMPIVTYGQKFKCAESRVTEPYDPSREYTAIVELSGKEGMVSIREFDSVDIRKGGTSIMIAPGSPWNL